MREAHENAHYLPGCPFPESLQVTDDLAAAVKGVRNVLVVVPSHAFAEMLRNIKPLLTDHARVAGQRKDLSLKPAAYSMR